MKRTLICALLTVALLVVVAVSTRDDVSAGSGISPCEDLSDCADAAETWCEARGSRATQAVIDFAEKTCNWCCADFDCNEMCCSTPCP